MAVQIPFKDSWKKKSEYGTWLYNNKGALCDIIITDMPIGKFSTGRDKFGVKLMSKGIQLFESVAMKIESKFNYETELFISTLMLKACQQLPISSVSPLFETS